MAKIKLGELFDKQKSIGKLLQCDIPIELAFKAKKMGKRINDELNNLFEVRNDLIRKNSVDPKSQTPTIPDFTDAVECEKHGITMYEAKIKFDAFMDEFKQVCDEEIEIPIVQINISDLNGSKLSVADLTALEDFIVG